MIRHLLTQVQAVTIQFTLDQLILLALGVAAALAIRGLIGWLKDQREQNEKCEELMKQIEDRLKPKPNSDKRATMTLEQRWSRFEARRALA